MKSHEESLMMKDKEISELRRSQIESKLTEKYTEKVQASIVKKDALTSTRDRVSELELQLEMSATECEGLKACLQSMNVAYDCKLKEMKQQQSLLL